MSDSVMICAGISIDECTNFHIIRNDRRLRDEILWPIEVSYAVASEDKSMLMDDNCKPSQSKEW